VGITKIDIDRFLELSATYPVLDVRSPGEYHHAHIPGAHNLPLFTDEERKVVGTAYKQKSRETAIKIGLDFFGPKMRKMVEAAEAVAGSEKHLLVHCWRGGMRSGAVAWLLDLYGFKVYTLIGGYKRYRNWIIETFQFPFSFTVLGGYTGSGKTHILEELAARGERVINLEKIASHKGSAFGNIGMPAQPGQEMFENLLGTALRRLGTSAPIWLEDESQRIGHINLPQTLWNLMRQSPIFFLDIPFAERLQHVIAEYGCLDRERMADAIGRIQKRLGPLETKLALQHLSQNNIESCFRILLTYYDKWYIKGLYNRGNVASLLRKVDCDRVNTIINAEHVLAKETIVK